MAKFEIGGEALTVPPMNFRALRAHRTTFTPAVRRLREKFDAFKAAKDTPDADATEEAVLEAIEVVYEARLTVIAAQIGRPVDDLMGKIRGQQELRGLTEPFDAWMGESGFETAGPQVSPPTLTGEGTAADHPA